MSMGESLGREYIEIGAEDDTEDDLRKIQAKLISQMRTAAKRAGDEIVKQFRQAGDEAGDRLLEEIEIDARKIDHVLDKLAEDREMNIDVTARTTDAAAQIFYTARDRIVNLWLRVRSSAAVRDIQTVLKGLSGANALQSWTDNLVAMAGALPQTILRMGMLATAAGTVVVPLVNMLGTVAPLAASLGALFPIIAAGPALFGGLVASIWVLSSAFSGLTVGISSSIDRGLSRLTDLQTAFAELKTAIQINFWDQFIDPFERLSSALLPQLVSGMSQLATAMGAAFGGIADGITESLGGDGLSNFFNNLSAAFANATPGLQAFASAFTTIMEKGSALLPVFGNWISQIGDSFNSWAEGADIAGMIQSAADAFGDLWDVATALWGVISGIFTAMDNGQSTGLESLAATLQTVADIVNGPTFQTALGLVFGMAATGADALASALTPIGDSLAALAPTIGYLLQTLGGTAGSVFTDIAAALASPVAQGGLQDAIGAISQMLIGIDWSQFSQIIGTLGSVIAALAPGVMNLVNAFLPLVNSILPLAVPLAGALASVLPQLVAGLQPVVDALVTGLLPVFTALQPMWPILIDAFVQLANILAGQLVALLPSLIDAFVALMPLIAVLLPLIAELAGGALTLLVTVLTSVLDIMGQAGAVVASTGLTMQDFATAGQVVGEVIRTVFEAIGNVIGATITFISGMFNAVSALLRGDFSGAFDAVRDTVDRVMAFFGTTVSTVTNNVIGFFNTLASGISSIMATVVSYISNGVNDVISWFAGLPGRVTGAIGDLGGQLYGVGRDILNGLWNGLKSMWDSVSNWISNTLGSIGDTVAGLLGIHSPSRVFMNIGEMVTAGFMAGISGLEDAANGAMNKAFQPVMNVNANGLPSPVKDQAGQYASSATTYNQQRTYQAGAFSFTGDDPWRVAAEVASAQAEGASI